MAHHSEDIPFGATGRFPDGQLTAYDEGEIAFGVTEHDGRVLLDFGKPVRSLGLTPGQALELASLLMKYSERAAISTYAR